jgi:hypothetical protein
LLVLAADHLWLLQWIIEMNTMDRMMTTSASLSSLTAPQKMSILVTGIPTLTHNEQNCETSRQARCQDRTGKCEYTEMKRSFDF